MEVTFSAAFVTMEAEGDVFSYVTFIDNHLLHMLLFSFERNPERFGTGNCFCMRAIRRFKLQLKVCKLAGVFSYT